ncbi:retrovirus-related pol polyprotein from transposon TNT 1-94 [Tanacetum coccineum]
MASSGSVNDGAKLTSCLKSGQIRDIDGMILGKDGKPMRRAIRVKIGETTVCEHQIEEPITDNPYEGLQTPGGWEDPKINAMQTEGSQTKPSFVNVVTGASNEYQNPKINFRAMTNPDTIENSDFVTMSSTLSLLRLRGSNRFLKKDPSLLGIFHLMLTKWSPNMVLSKDKVTRVPVWVKLHKVPAVAYSEEWQKH